MQPKLRRYETNATEAIGVPTFVDEFRQLTFLTHYDHTTAFVSDYQESHYSCSLEMQVYQEVMLLHIRCPKIQQSPEIIFAVEKSTNIQKSQIHEDPNDAIIQKSKRIQVKLPGIHDSHYPFISCFQSNSSPKAAFLRHIQIHVHLSRTPIASHASSRRNERSKHGHKNRLSIAWPVLEYYNYSNWRQTVHGVWVVNCP